MRGRLSGRKVENKAKKRERKGERERESKVQGSQERKRDSINVYKGRKRDSRG